MRPKLLMLAGVTKENRHKIMADINDAVAHAGGWITGHTLFSNIAITFKLVLSPTGLTAFRQRVAETGIVLDGESVSRIEDILDAPVPAETEITTALNVTFIHNEPDLRRDVPAVPG